LLQAFDGVLKSLDIRSLEPGLTAAAEFGLAALVAGRVGAEAFKHRVNQRLLRLRLRPWVASTVAAVPGSLPGHLWTLLPLQDIDDPEVRSQIKAAVSELASAAHQLPPSAPLQRRLEAAYLRSLFQGKGEHVQGPLVEEARTALSAAGGQMESLSRAQLYDVTHTAFWLTDMGRCPTLGQASVGRAMTARASERADAEDWDLAGELSAAAACLAVRPRAGVIACLEERVSALCDAGPPTQSTYHVGLVAWLAFAVSQQVAY
jgi:uncharacterized protein DUF6895